MGKLKSLVQYLAFWAQIQDMARLEQHGLLPNQLSEAKSSLPISCNELRNYIRTSCKLENDRSYCKL